MRALFPAFAVLLLPVLAFQLPPGLFTPNHLRQLKNRTASLIRHGYDAYMVHGFPADEVRPLSCQPYGPNIDDPFDLRNDALGNVSLTIIDNIDTLIITQQWLLLEHALEYLQKHQETIFDQDHTVQVFEASIRWLGGLLLAHLILSEQDALGIGADLPDVVANYDGFLLTMAYDLGIRLIPAYITSTQIPLPRINLRHGLAAVPAGMNQETCTSGAATPFLEFRLLAHLTGDKSMASHPDATFWKLWMLRSQLGLMPLSISPLKNTWTDSFASIGALVDLFYEYALKGSILFNDDALGSAFALAYRSIMTHNLQTHGDSEALLFAGVDAEVGNVFTPWIDSLGAFWAGVQVLAGQLSDAVSSHVTYLKIWNTYDGIPERWNFQRPAGVLKQFLVSSAISLEWYPLRPEFIELTYYLFRATRDPLYLQIGLRILTLFESRFHAPCGFAGVQDLRTGEFQDRMETFVLGELLKYLWLLFDDENASFLHRPAMARKNWVFSTEAHPLWYSEELGTQSARDFRHRLRQQAAKTTTFEASGFVDRMRVRLGKAKVLAADTATPEAVPDSECDERVLNVQKKLDMCEIWPRQLKRDSRFVESGYYHWSQFFSADARLEDTLLRPEHFREHDDGFEEHVIELAPDFFKAFSVTAAPQCARIATTPEMTIFLGNLQRPEQYDIFEVKESFSNFSSGDIIMPDLGGSLRVEELSVGSIDLSNSDMTYGYFRSLRPHNSEFVLYRVSRLNELYIGPLKVLWVRNSRIGNSTSVDPDGHVRIMGRWMENLRVYDDFLPVKNSDL